MLNSHSFWHFLWAIVPMLPQGVNSNHLEGTRPLYCVHSAEDSDDKERGSVPKRSFDLLYSEKDKYRSFSVIWLGSGPWIFQPPQLFSDNSNSGYHYYDTVTVWPWLWLWLRLVSFNLPFFQWLFQIKQVPFRRWTFENVAARFSTGWKAFLTPNQQCQSTDISCCLYFWEKQRLYKRNTCSTRWAIEIRWIVW